MQRQIKKVKLVYQLGPRIVAMRAQFLRQNENSFISAAITNKSSLNINVLCFILLILKIIV